MPQGLNGPFTLKKERLSTQVKSKSFINIIISNGAHFYLEEVV